MVERLIFVDGVPTVVDSEVKKQKQKPKKQPKQTIQLQQKQILPQKASYVAPDFYTSPPPPPPTINYTLPPPPIPKKQNEVSYIHSVGWVLAACESGVILTLVLKLAGVI